MNRVRFQFATRSLLIIFCLVALGATTASIFTFLWLEILSAFLVMSFVVLICSHEHPLAFFLKYINPLVALVVLAICVFAASIDIKSNKVVYEGWFKDSISSYFLAKGIFCAMAIFLLGKLVEIMLKGDSKG